MGGDNILEVDNNSLQEEPKLEDKLENDMPDSSGNMPDDGPQVVKELMEKMGIQKDEPVATDTTDGDGEVDIPDEFTNAALSAGWEEKDITEFAADYNNEQLKEMIPFLLEDEEQPEPEVEPVAKERETPSTGKTELPKETVDAIKEELRKEFEAELKELKEKAAQVDKANEEFKQQAMVEVINDAFDEAGKEFEVFGKTKELPVFTAGPKKGHVIPTSPQFKAREEVYQKARVFIEAGVDVKDAMTDALTWYKGKYLEGDVKRSFVKNLKRSEQKLSAKRVSKETAPHYENEEDEQAAFILKEAERLGIKLKDN